jgi:hypothetical protein
MRWDLAALAVTMVGCGAEPATVQDGYLNGQDAETANDADTASDVDTANDADTTSDADMPDVPDTAGCPGGPAACDDDNVCTTDSCLASGECDHAVNSLPCDDGDACTVNDGCAAGVCVGQQTCCDSAADCDDANPCTLDACNASKSCAHAPKPDGAACSDGSACTDGDACADGMCASTPQTPCSDDNPCTDDACDPVTGDCVFSNNTAACDDGNDCTTDTCDIGACVGVPVAGAVACDDGNACTAFDACAAGGCAGDPVDGAATCDDGVACTVDGCDPKSGCVHSGKLFTTTVGGDTDHVAHGLVAVADGFVGAGEISGPGGALPNFWLARANATGGLLWEKTYDGQGASIAHGLVALADGFAMAGETSPGSTRLVRTDAVGTEVWNKVYSGGAARAIVALADGGFAMAGRASGPGGADFRLLRTDAAGDLLWSKSFDRAYDDATALVAIADGYAIAGLTESDGPTGADFWLVRTDESGNLIWDKTFGGVKGEVANTLAAVPGGFVIAGYTESKGAGAQDFWLVRTDLAGSVLWDRTYGGKTYDEANSLVVLPDGFAIAGATLTKTGYDLNLIRTDAWGNVIWAQTYGSSLPEFATGVVLLSDGGFAVAGRTFNTAPIAPAFRLVRTDPWGQATCAAAGVCAGTLASTCDDSNPCTADLCDAAKGCTHADLPNGATCGAGTTCTDGACAN